MDCDERYDSKELKEQVIEMREDDIDTVYSPIYSYYWDEQHYFIDSYYVPSLFKVNDRCFEKGSAAVLTDPVRRMQERKYKISTMPMHHYTYLRKAYHYKLNNSIMSRNPAIAKNIEKIQKYLYEWKEGDKALVHINDMKKGGKLALGKVELIKVIEIKNRRE